MTTNLQHFGVLGMHWGKRKMPTKESDLSDREKRVLQKIRSRGDKIMEREFLNERLSTGGTAKAHFIRSVDQKFGSQAAKKVAEADLEASRQYVKNYLKLSGKAVITGLVVAGVGKAVAQMYINAREAQRFSELFG